MYVYEFDMKLDFFVANGYANLKVNGGRLELEKEPDKETLALIEQCGGRLVGEDRRAGEVQADPQPQAKKATKAREA